MIRASSFINGNSQVQQNEVRDTIRKTMKERPQSSENWLLDSSVIHFMKELDVGDYGRNWRGYLEAPCRLDVVISEMEQVDYNAARTLFNLNTRVLTCFVGAQNKEFVCIGAHSNVTVDDQYRTSEKVPLSVRVKWGKDLAEAVSFIHDTQLVHGQITTPQCFVTPTELQLSVLPILSKKKCSGGTRLSRSSFVNLPPELWLSSNPTPASDAHMTASTLFAIFSGGRKPFDGWNDSLLRKMIATRQQLPPDVPDGTPAPFANWMKLAWNREPLCRPTVINLVARVSETVEGSVEKQTCDHSSVDVEVEVKPTSTSSQFKKSPREILKHKLEIVRVMAQNGWLHEQKKKATYGRFARDCIRAGKKNPESVDVILTLLINKDVSIDDAKQLLIELDWSLEQTLSKLGFCSSEIRSVKREFGSGQYVIRSIMALNINLNRKIAFTTFLEKLRNQMAMNPRAAENDK